ncbi:MAG: 2-dehydro-3-deoxy-D-gluconate 5-dehydrogenase, partial [Planctomycetota bacterium]
MQSDQKPNSLRRRVVVTGGSSGIGRAIAEAFADNGDQVTATCLSESDLIASRGLKPWHGNVTPAILDVTCLDQIDAFISSLESLDILVNAAGIIQRNGVEFTPDGFDRTLSVNLNAVMHMCLKSHKLLMASQNQGGASIINIASMLSYFGSAFAPGYAAAKGGIVQLTKSLAAAWASDSIRVNAIAPGWIRTSLTAPLQADEQRSRPILERTPMGRWGLPEEVAPAAVFL